MEECLSYLACVVEPSTSSASLTKGPQRLCLCLKSLPHPLGWKMISCLHLLTRKLRCVPVKLPKTTQQVYRRAKAGPPLTSSCSQPHCQTKSQLYSPQKGEFKYSLPGHHFIFLLLLLFWTKLSISWPSAMCCVLVQYLEGVRSFVPRPLHSYVEVLATSTP